MCGIAGVVGVGAAAHEDLVWSMVGAQRHRGPDDAHVVTFDNAVLGTARLAVVDPVGGRQPVLGPDGATALTCNGEIYGHRRVREACTGYPFRTGSDVEVILALYDRYGDGLLEHLPGTFAFALWDDRRQRLMLARDRFGERPLYWARTPDGLLVFASEPDALLASKLVHPTVDRAVLAQVLRQGYVPPGQAIWREVKSLPHAHRLRWNLASAPEADRWWEPPLEASDPGPEEARAWLRRELERAVVDQLEADVPVGTFLSGGLDSSTVASLAARHHPNILAFAFDMPGDSELPFARAVAERNGLVLLTCEPDLRDLAGQIAELATVWDEPFADSSALPTRMLSRFAREHTTVALTGDGADELLGGYLFWTRGVLEPGDPARGDNDARVPHPPAAGSQSLAVRARVRAGRLLWRGARPVNGASADGSAESSAVARRYAPFRSYFEPAELSAMGLPPAGLDHIDFGRYSCGGVGAVSRFDLDHYLPGDILVKTDRASMSWGLEVRSPFLDTAVAEGCLALPTHYKVDGSHEKLLLRDAFADLLPAAVLDRPKQGFGAPMATWLADDGVMALKQAQLVDAGAPLFDLVDHAAVQPFVAADDQRTWNLLMVALWWQRHREAVAT